MIWVGPRPPDHQRGEIEFRAYDALPITLRAGGSNGEPQRVKVMRPGRFRRSAQDLLLGSIPEALINM